MVPGPDRKLERIGIGLCQAPRLVRILGLRAKSIDGEYRAIGTENEVMFAATVAPSGGDARRVPPEVASAKPLGTARQSAGGQGSTGRCRLLFPNRVAACHRTAHRAVRPIHAGQQQYREVGKSVANDTRIG